MWSILLLLRSDTNFIQHIVVQPGFQVGTEHYQQARLIKTEEESFLPSKGLHIGAFLKVNQKSKSVSTSVMQFK